MFKNMSLKVKIYIIIFIAILLPSVVTSSLIFRRSEMSITNQTAKSVTMSMENSIKSLDSGLITLIGVTSRMNDDEDFVREVALANEIQDESKTKQYAILYRILNNHLSRIEAPNIIDNIDSFYLYLPGQNTVITTDTTYYENIDESNISITSKGKQEEGYWYSAYPINFYTLQGKNLEETLISYNQYITTDNGDVVGICTLNLKKSVYDEIYKNSLLSIPGSLGVFGEGDEIVDKHLSSPIENSELLELKAYIKGQDRNGNVMMTLNGEDHFIVYLTSNYTGWMYATIIKSSDILGQLYEAKQFLVVMICLIVLLVFVITAIIVRVFYKPIEKLVHAMQQIENRNLDVRIDDKRRDEYQKVYTVFNNMVEELNELILNLTTEKMLNKEAKIKLLQEQINPHFLYNTLDSIYSIAKLQNVPEISQIVLALSSFFRVSLSGGKDIVCLKDAISIVENYLTVQNIRFKGKFKFDVIVPNYLLKCRVPKLLLQPFVENSIYHGLEAKKEQGHLEIVGRQQNDMLVLTVVDDGVGIAQDKLIMIRESIKKEISQDDQNFAIKNLNTQLKLLYGNQYGVCIESELGKGTTVTIRAPIVYEDNGYN